MTASERPPIRLADLLVEDLKNDGSKLRQEVPVLLKELVDSGKLMLVENEYLLQTKEGANWNQDFNRRRGQILNDDSRLNDEREKLLREALDASLRSVEYRSRQFSSATKTGDRRFPTRARRSPMAAWSFGFVTAGPSRSETVATDAQAAGNTSPMLFGFLPRTAHEELRQNLASMIAAKDTIENHGTPTTGEAIQAR